MLYHDEQSASTCGVEGVNERTVRGARGGASSYIGQHSTCASEHASWPLTCRAAAHQLQQSPDVPVAGDSVAQTSSCPPIRTGLSTPHRANTSCLSHLSHRPPHLCHDHNLLPGSLHQLVHGLVVPGSHHSHIYTSTPHTCVMTTICCPGRCINWCVALSYRGHTVHTCTPHTCVMTTICCPGRCINWCMALSYKRRGELFTHSSPYSWRYGWLSGTNTSPEGREGGGKGVGRRRPVSLNTLQFRIRQAHE